MTGWRLLLTRPAEECGAVAASLAEAGIRSASLPLLAIEPLAETAEQRATILELDRYCAVIVVSKPAARLGIELLDKYWPQPPLGPAWFSVGAATGAILESYGLDVSWPERGDDSEALLALPRLDEALARPDPKVLILRGEGGREFLAETLRGRGVQVDMLELYRRSLPDYPALTLATMVRSERLNGLVVSSGQVCCRCVSWRPIPGPKCLSYPCSYPVRGWRRWLDSWAPNELWIAVAQELRPCWRPCGKPRWPLPDAKDGNVSEADSKKEPLQPRQRAGPATEPAKPAKPAKPVPSKPAANGGAKSLAALALLVGLGGVALGGYGIWQLQQLGAQQDQRLEAMQGLPSRRVSWPSANASWLRASVGWNSCRRPASWRSAVACWPRCRVISSAFPGGSSRLGASRESGAWPKPSTCCAWRCCDSRPCRTKSAEMLVHEADLILQKQDDPGAYGTRQKLLEGLEALRSLPELDRTGLFLQLGHCVGRPASSARSPGIRQRRGAAGKRPGQSLAALAERIDALRAGGLRCQCRREAAARRQTLGQVRLALSLAIEQAQWAVLNGNTRVYRQSLEQASTLLRIISAMITARPVALEALTQREVEVSLPDLAPALQALQAYVQKRERRDESDAGETSAQPEAQDAEQEAQRT